MDRTLSLLVKFAALDRLTAPLRTMSGTSRKTALDLAATRREVLQLEKASGQIKAFRDQQNAIAKTYAEVDQARRRMRELRADIAQAKGPTEQLTRRFEAMQNKVARLDDRLEKQTGRLGALRTGLQGAGIDTMRLADAEDRLGQRLGVANRRLEEQRAHQERLNAQAKRVADAQTRGANLRGAGFRSLAIGSQVVRPGLAVAAEARDFQSIMVDIGQKADLSQQATHQMAADLLIIGPKIAQLPAALAEGVDTLAGLGLDPNLAKKIIRPIGLAATAYKAEITDLSNATYSSIDNLRVPIASTTQALDIMAFTGKAGAFEIKDMAKAFPELTASAAALGQRGIPAVADLAAALQIVRKGAGDSASAANNLQNLLVKINSTDATKNFKKFGIDLPAALKRAYKEGKTPLEAIVELVKKATGGDMSKLPQLFGDMQVQQALRPLLSNMDLYRKIRADALKQTGVVERDFADRMANDGAAKQAKFNAQMERLKIVVGDRLLPALNDALERAGDLADRMSAWADRNPRLASSLGLIATITGALLFVIGGILVAIGSILGPIASLGFIASGASTKIGFLARGFQLIWRGVVLLASPLRIIGQGILWILGAVAAVLGIPVEIAAAIVVAIGVAAFAIYHYWDQIKAGASAAWAWIKSTFMAGLSWFVSLNTQMAQIGVNLVTGLVNGIGSMFGALKAKIVSLGKGAVDWFKGVLGIHSPSRVFAQLGGHMMTGLSAGLDRGASGPLARIQGAGRSLTKAMAISVAGAGIAATPAAAAGAAQPAGPGLVIEKFIVQQLPGQDAKALAAEIRAQLEAFMRGQTVGQRSSYRDDE